MIFMSTYIAQWHRVAPQQGGDRRAGGADLHCGDRHYGDGYGGGATNTFRGAGDGGRAFCQWC